MYRKILFLTAVILFTAAVGGSVKAQDICNANTKYCKVLAEKGGMKMMMITLPAGAKLATHTHPDYAMYVLKGGLYEWKDDGDAKIQKANLKPGDAFPGDPEGAHHSWNAGKTTIQFILVEKH
jgi:quercetin dioxygenase-like cupin family protein